MVKIIIITVLLCYTTAALARDETAACRDITRQTCTGFQQCCSRTCGGAHDTSCQESNGRISQANCECRRSGGGSVSGSGGAGSVSGSGGREIDYSASCRSSAHGSCNTFKTCCQGRCANPLRMTCNSFGSSLTDALCHCPVSAGHFIHTTPYYSGGGHGSMSGNRDGHGSISGGGGTHGSTSGGTHGSMSGGGGSSQSGLREHGDQDFTQTCARNYHDCTTFRNCCTNRCAGRNTQTTCQQHGSSLRNTLCKCTG